MFFNLAKKKGEKARETQQILNFGTLTYRTRVKPRFKRTRITRATCTPFLKYIWGVLRIMKFSASVEILSYFWREKINYRRIVFVWNENISLKKNDITLLLSQKRQNIKQRWFEIVFSTGFKNSETIVLYECHDKSCLNAWFSKWIFEATSLQVTELSKAVLHSMMWKREFRCIKKVKFHTVCA